MPDKVIKFKEKMASIPVSWNMPRVMSVRRLISQKGYMVSQPGTDHAREWIFLFIGSNLPSKASQGALPHPWDAFYERYPNEYY